MQSPDRSGLRIAFVALQELNLSHEIQLGVGPEVAFAEMLGKETSLIGKPSISDYFDTCEFQIPDVKNFHSSLPESPFLAKPRIPML